MMFVLRAGGRSLRSRGSVGDAAVNCVDGPHGACPTIAGREGKRSKAA